MKLFKKNGNKETHKLPMTGKVKKGLPLLLSGSYGGNIYAWHIYDRLCRQ